MRRRGVLVTAWVLGTAAATLVAWAAVRQVAAEVAPPGVLPLPAVAAVEAPTAAPPAAASDQPGAPPTEDAPTARAVTEAYTLTGGVVTVRYRGGRTTLVGATPNSGFEVDVHDSGPDEVEVRFRSDDHESRLVTRWTAGAPRPQRDERPR